MRNLKVDRRCELTVSGQPYLSVADLLCIQKPVVFKRKTQKGEGQAVLIRALRMLTFRHMWECNNENAEYISSYRQRQNEGVNFHMQKRLHLVGAEEAAWIHVLKDSKSLGSCASTRIRIHNLESRIYTGS